MRRLRGYPCTPTKTVHRRWRLYHFCGFGYPIREVIPIAIYHCNIGIVSRGKGKSAVAAAAYRSGEKITNEWDGMTHDYTRKRGVVHTEILLPPHAPPSFSDRSTLWNSVELYEKAGNAQLAREIDAALPIELSREEQIRLVREYCSSQFVSRGMCVDFAIHDTDSGNPHCHIMLSTFMLTQLSDYLQNRSSMTLISQYILDIADCVRIQYNGTQNSIIRWKDEVIIKDKKINMDLIKMSRLMLIDTNAVEAKFQQFFNRLDVTTDLDAVIHLQKEIQKYADDNGVPEPLEVNYKLANSRFEIANRARKDWDDSILKVEDELEIVMERGNVYNSLSALEALDEIPLYSIFNENGFTMSEDYRARLLELGNEARNIVNTYFDTWLDDTIHCKSVEAMTQFEKHIKRCNEKLIKFGFSSFAQRLSAKGESELAKKDEIRSRQELISDGQKYLAAYKKVSIKNYTDVSDMLSKAKDLLDRLSKFENALGNDAKRLHSQLDQCVGKLDNAKKKMQQDMENIWEDLATAQTLEDIENVQSCIAMVMNYRMTTRDLQDFEELNTALSAFISDVGVLKSAVNDRNLLQQEIVVLRNKYSDAEMDFDVKSVLEAVIKSIENEIDIKDHIWRTKYLTLGNQTREEIHRWKDNTSILPAYLKRDTIDAVEKMRIEADQIVSNAMIEDVVFYFKKLNSEERERCLKLLQNQ